MKERADEDQRRVRHRTPMSRYRRPLLIVTAVAEMATGLALLLLPAIPLKLLIGVTQLGPEVELVSRIAGAALLAIGIASWLARADSNNPAQRGLLTRVLIYDGAAAALLAYAGLILKLDGIALWPAVVLHAALAVWCLVSLGRSPHDFAKGTKR